MKVISVYTIRDNKGYIFSYLDDTDKFIPYLPTIQTILNSTKI